MARASDEVEVLGLDGLLAEPTEAARLGVADSTDPKHREDSWDAVGLSSSGYRGLTAATLATPWSNYPTLRHRTRATQT